MFRWHRVMVFSSLLAIFAVVRLAEGSGYKGIYVGQPESSLPLTLRKILPTYCGVHEGAYFQVHVLDGKVRLFDVIYDGKGLDGSVMSTSMSLAEAARVHSFSEAERPRLALGRGEGRRIYGIVDLDNAIYYLTDGTTGPSSKVFQVSYLDTTAPVLQASDEDLLAVTYVDSLRAQALARPVRSPKLPAAHGSHLFSTRGAALEALTEQADRVIGRGKRTLALIAKAETWLEVDETHDEARKTFRQLRQFRRDFGEEMVTFTTMYRANQKILRPEDAVVAREPLDLDRQIKRGMTQLVAMGFREFDPSE